MAKKLNIDDRGNVERRRCIWHFIYELGKCYNSKPFEISPGSYKNETDNWLQLSDSMLKTYKHFTTCKEV